MKNILEIHKLCKKYDSFALQDVSFSLPGGSIMGFVGENGAGKTTTLKLILNEIRRDSGKIKLFGLDNQRDERMVKEQIGVVLDENCINGEFSVKDVGTLWKHFYKNWDNGLYLRYLEQFELPQKKAYKEFSKGMKMKLNLAAALAHKPRLLILDEATSGLDPVMRSDILDIFLDFIQDEDHGVLLSSHITSDLERAADYITFLHKGQVMLSGSKDDLIYSYGVLKCGTSDFDKIDRSDILRWRKNEFEYEALVSDKDAMHRKYPKMTMDHVTIDDIMLFYGKGKGARE